MTSSRVYTILYLYTDATFYVCYLILSLVTSTSALLGFTNLGDIDTCLTWFKQSVEGGKSEGIPLVNTMLVILMYVVCVTFHGQGTIQRSVSLSTIPLCQFVRRSTVSLVWEAVARLERYGVRVLGSTCDGLAANRRFFRLHKQRHTPCTQSPKSLHR